MTQIKDKFFQLLEKIGTALNDFAIWSYENVLTPIGQFIESGFNKMVDGFNFMIEKVVDGIQKLGTLAKDGAIWTYDNVLTPIGHSVSAICIQMNNLLFAMGEKISEMSALGYNYITMTATGILQKAYDAGNSLNDHVIQPVYIKGCDSASSLYEGVLVPTAEKVDYFVREYIPEVVEKSATTAEEAITRVKDSAWRSIDYLSSLLSSEAA